MIAWFARNHVAANLLMLVIVAGGLIALATRIPLEVFPDIEYDVVSVSVSLRGATPAQVEESVTIKIEEALEDLPDIADITSHSSEGAASVSIELAHGADRRALLNDIKTRVDAINTLPADAEKPLVELTEHKREVLTVALAGDASERELRELADSIREELLRIPGISQIELDGVRDYEIAIEVSQDTLRQYALTLAEIATAISNNSRDVSAGNVKTRGGEILLRSEGQAYHRDEFARLVIRSQADGGLLHLGEIADIRDGFEESPVRTRFNQKPAVFLDIYRVGQESALDVAAKVKDYVAEKQQQLPQQISLSIWRDRSLIVKKRLATLGSNALQGGLLVLCLLALFLRPAIAFWVFIGIPIAFTGSFMLLAAFGVSINLLSLFGFILVLGIVVDDAIVTGENVYAHMRHQADGLNAAITGAQEVAVPVTFGVLTTIAAFLPLLAIEGDRGAMFAQISLVVIPVFVFSLIESKFVLPAHLKHLNYQSRASSGFALWQQNFSDRFEAWVARHYRPLLERVLALRYFYLLLFLGILVVLVSLLNAGHLRFIFFPKIQSEVARATLTMPVGTAFEVTDAAVARMAAAAWQLKQQHVDQATGESVIRDIQSTTGSDSHIGKVRFEIIAPEERHSSITSKELVAEWRQMIGPIAGAENVNFRAEIGRASDPVDIQLQGNNIETLAQVAGQVQEKLAGYEGVFDIADSFSHGKQSLNIEPTALAYALGFDRNTLVSQVRQAFFGLEAQRIQRGREDVRVMVRLPLAERASIAQLREVVISSPNGQRVALGELVTLAADTTPATIVRKNHYRTVNVTADVDKETVNMTSLQRDLESYLPQLLAQYPGVHYSLEGEAREQQQSFSSLLLGLGFVLFAIYALLAIPLKSYFQPLIVMSVIPFSIIGAVAGHWLMGMELTIMSVFGMLALTGVVVNDSLVLVDFINRHRVETGSLHEAVLDAGVRRFRPVMLTSLTTFIGLMPLLFEKSTQAQFLIPMAVSLGFGILFATVITLFLIPINYLLVADVKRHWQR